MKMFQVSRAVYVTVQISSLLSNIVHLTAIHYMGMSERVSGFGHSLCLF